MQKCDRIAPSIRQNREKGFFSSFHVENGVNGRSVLLIWIVGADGAEEASPSAAGVGAVAAAVFMQNHKISYINSQWSSISIAQNEKIWKIKLLDWNLR